MEDPEVILPSINLEKKVEEKSYKEVFCGIVKFSKGRANIDWKKFYELSECPDENNQYYKLAVEYLVNLDILSFNKDENYIVHCQGMMINPEYKEKILYFTREEDAARFYRTIESLS